MVTKNLSEIVDGIIEIIKLPDNRAALGLTDRYTPGSVNEYGVFFGEELGSISHLPVIMVQGERVEYDLYQTGFKTENRFNIGIAICHANIAQASSTVRKDSLQKAEALRDILNADLKVGNRVIYGYVNRIEVGYMATQDGMIFSHQLSWVGMNTLRI